MAPRKSSRVVKKPKKHDDDSDYAEEREGQGEWEPQDEEEVGEEEYEERGRCFPLFQSGVIRLMIGRPYE